MKQRSTWTLAGLMSIALVAGACSSDKGDRSLTVYSGRSEELVGPLFKKFEESSGIKLNVLYGDSAALSSQLIEEGAKSPADVFFSQAPGPLGAVDGAALLRSLDGDTTKLVDVSSRAQDGEWVGISARARVLVYDPAKTPKESLPTSIMGLAEPGSDLTVGIAATNASFQDFVSAMRVQLGDDATLLFLDGLADNGVRTYPNNVSIVEAVGRGEVNVGLVNHYYNLELRAQDASLATENYFFTPGDLGSLVLVSGAGVLKSSDDTKSANEFIAFLLSEESQKFFATETFEYPLASGVAGPPDQPTLADLGKPSVELDKLGQQLSSTLTLIEKAGLVG
jgi:iron(III) transport system substrate-binding protein